MAEAEDSVEAEVEAAPEEAPAAEAAPEEAPAAAAEPQLEPKQRRQRARAAKAAKQPVRKVLTAEERQSEREALRARKAQVRRAGRARARAKYRASEHERVPTPPREHVPGAQKTRQGVVVSDKADKTITVRIDVARRHRRYQKIVRTSSTVHAHDESNDAHIGDTVVVRESRPLSRTKRWRLIEVVERAR
jgi:small subunit ribosomal protein S17